jgi:hypothetical protein
MGEAQGAIRMYRNILVPIDDSQLAVETVQKAVTGERSVAATNPRGFA